MTTSTSPAFSGITVLSDSLIFVQVMASKTKIFIVLEFVTGGELFDKIVRTSYLLVWINFFLLDCFSCLTVMLVKLCFVNQLFFLDFGLAKIDVNFRLKNSKLKRLDVE